MEASFVWLELRDKEKQKPLFLKFLETVSYSPQTLWAKAPVS